MFDFLTLLPHPSLPTTPEIVPLEYSAPLSKPAFLSQQRWWLCLNDGDVMNVKAEHPRVLAHAL